MKNSLENILRKEHRRNRQSKLYNDPDSDLYAVEVGLERAIQIVKDREEDYLFEVTFGFNAWIQKTHLGWNKESFKLYLKTL